MRPRLGSINKLSLQHASFQPNSINEKRKTEKQMGESEMKHREISRCHRTDVYLLYLTLPSTSSHTWAYLLIAARRLEFIWHISSWRKASSSSLVIPSTLILSLILDLQYQPSAHLIYSSSLATVLAHHLKRITVSKQLQTEEIRV